MIEQITPAFLLLHHFSSRCGSAYRYNLLMTAFVDWGVSSIEVLWKWTLMQWVDLMVMGSGLEESWYSLSLLFAWTPSIAHTRAAVSVPVRCFMERVVSQSYLLSFPSSNWNVIFPRIFFQITSKVAYLEYPIQLIHNLCFTNLYHYTWEPLMLNQSTLTDFLAVNWVTPSSWCCFALFAFFL